MIKYVDIPSIVQVIGGIYNNPQLLDLEDKYHFCEEDFTEEFHKIIFGSIYNLHNLGAKEVTINAIEDYLEQRPKKFAIYKTNNGAEYLQTIKETTQLAAFDYYYNRMKKMTLLRMYQKAGVDLSWLYDIDNILDAKKKQIQEDWLDNTSLNEIADLIDKKITDIRLKYINNADTYSVNAGTGIMELLTRLKESPDVGYPLYGPLINTVCRGARLGKFYLRSSSTGIGKAIPNSTIIPTPNGEKRVGNIREGDYIFDAFGKPTKVLKVYPQGKKEVWEVIFKDNRKAKCCKEHLWSYCTNEQKSENKKARKFYTNTLAELNQKELKKIGYGYTIHVPMNFAVEYPTKNYYIKPYTFGLLLGDGSFRYSKKQKALSYSSENEILPNAIAKEMNWNVRKNSEYNYSWTFSWLDFTNKKHKNVWVEEILKDYPDLWNAKSEDKYIPKEYLEGNIEQRLDLLNGLLDSDGSVDKKGRIIYCTISFPLCKNIIQLCNSLGYKATYLIDNHKVTNICYKVEITGRPEDKIKLFKLHRKKSLILSWFNNGKRKEKNDFNPIVAINNLHYKEEMTCFYVDNDEHLFLMNDYIVTHNTRSMVADVCNIACDKIYNIYEHKWKDNGNKEPAVIITTEQEIDEIQTMALAFLANVNEEHIINTEYVDDESERILYAAELLKKCPLYIQQLPDFSLQDIENVIKLNIRENKTHYVFLDYIHTSMKILSEISSKTGVKGLREDNILFMISTRLKDICNEYGVFILSSTQLNSEYRTAKRYDQNLLRGAKSIADKIDLGIIMLETDNDDITALQNVIERGGFDIPKIKMSIYKNRRGRWKDILLWCRADRSTCRIEPMFVTNYNYELIQMDNLNIRIKTSLESSAF